MGPGPQERPLCQHCQPMVSTTEHLRYGVNSQLCILCGLRNGTTTDK
jgi:hypothetical protein